MKLSELKEQLDFPDDYNVTLSESDYWYYLRIRSPRKISESREWMIDRKIYFKYDR